jgi:hypothetical protein
MTNKRPTLADALNKPFHGRDEEIKKIGVANLNSTTKTPKTKTLLIRLNAKDHKRLKIATYLYPEKLGSNSMNKFISDLIIKELDKLSL